ncbi:MAG: hypothetical protein KH135_00210 [Firmicutes bacterium]|nr:hypothetical protein [Bacillota bacterium]
MQRLEYSNHTLDIYLSGRVDAFELQVMQKRMYSIIEEYGIYNVQLHTGDSVNLTSNSLSWLEDDYRSNYHGNFKILD